MPTWSAASRIDRSRHCGFAVKAKNAQNAGAFGVIIVNNVAGSAPGLGGCDPTIVIPTVSVSQADGAVLKQAVADAVKFGSRSRPGAVVAAFAIDTSRTAGADAAGSSAALHAEPADRRLVGLALGRERVSEPARWSRTSTRI